MLFSHVNRNFPYYVEVGFDPCYKHNNENNNNEHLNLG